MDDDACSGLRRAQEQAADLRLALRFAESLGVEDRKRFLLQFFRDPANGFAPDARPAPNLDAVISASDMQRTPPCRELPHRRPPHRHIARPKSRRSVRGAAACHGSEASDDEGDVEAFDLPARPESRRGRVKTTAGAAGRDSPLPEPPCVSGSDEGESGAPAGHRDPAGSVLRCVALPRPDQTRPRTSVRRRDDGRHAHRTPDAVSEMVRGVSRMARGGHGADSTNVLTLIGRLALHAAATRGHVDPQAEAGLYDSPPQRPMTAEQPPSLGTGAHCTPQRTPHSARTGRSGRSGWSPGSVFTTSKLRKAVGRVEATLREHYPSWGGCAADPGLSMRLQTNIMDRYDGADVASNRQALLEELTSLLGKAARRSAAGT